MQTVKTIGLDIAKSVFQVHGINAEGNVVLRRQLKRRYGASRNGANCEVLGANRTHHGRAR